MDTTLIKLVNPEFTIEFMGQEYRVRKATLDKTMQYQMRVQEYNKNGEQGTEAKVVAFCLYLILKDKIPDLTEQIALENIPGDINPVEFMVNLGFFNPSKMLTKKENLEEKK